MSKTKLAKKQEVATRSEIAATFGRWIKDKRQDARLTQTATALRAEISRVYLARIEAGEIPSRSIILNLAHALNVPEREALHRGGLSSGLEEADLPLAMINFNLLSPEAQGLISDHIDNLRKMEESRRDSAGKTRKRA